MGPFKNAPITCTINPHSTAQEYLLSDISGIQPKR